MQRVDVEALVAVAHRRLQLRRLLIAIERNPFILEDIDMATGRTIGRPINLAGFSGHLQRAEKLEERLSVTGARYTTVLDDIEDQEKALVSHVGALEVTRASLDQVINRMAPGSNGAPNGGGESSEKSSTALTGGEVGQVIDGKPV